MSNQNAQAIKLSRTASFPVFKAHLSNFSRLTIWQNLKRWYIAYRRRQRLLSLLRYDDHILDDMGYTRADLHAVAKLPLSVDAHQVLKDLFAQRKLPRPAR